MNFIYPRREIEKAIQPTKCILNPCKYSSLTHPLSIALIFVSFQVSIQFLFEHHSCLLDSDHL